MSYYCNPVNLEYQYQFFKTKPEIDDICRIHREAADPSVILFNSLYYLFPSMTAGFYTSEDLVKWEFHQFLNEMPIYDYAPDIRAIDGYLYFCASAEADECSFYRTKDPLTEPFEEIKGSFLFWDPNLFSDDDGRVYLYWGSSNSEPIYGIELDSKTLQPISEKMGLILAQETQNGYERMGEDYIPPKTEAEIQETIDEVLSQRAPDGYEPDDEMLKKLHRWFGNSPYIEGPWMTKHQGKYYLQYACTGTEYNTYADGVYVGSSPMGPFILAKNNPYSLKPGGFITGAGHGSTFEDKVDGFWHISTMRISKNHNFERRLGLWKTDFDEEGQLFCDQRYGDWPISPDAKIWQKPDWMLLSYQKPVKASSGQFPNFITDEDIRTWWQADTSDLDEWAEIDLEEIMDVHAVQINFADNWTVDSTPDMDFFTSFDQLRHIDNVQRYTRWVLEGSEDGIKYEILENKSEADTDLPHDLIVWEAGQRVRYLRLKAIELPYGQKPCISGMRVFGLGNGKKPDPVCHFRVSWNHADPLASLDMHVSWENSCAVGCNVLWGDEPEKLYHSYMVYGKTELDIGSLVQGSPVFLRIDTFNENGITEGVTEQVR